MKRIAKSPPNECTVAVSAEIVPQTIMTVGKYTAGFPNLLRKRFDGTVKLSGNERDVMVAEHQLTLHEDITDEEDADTCL